MYKTNLITLTFLLTALFISCENQSTNTDEVEFSSVLEEQAAFGYEVSELAATSEDIFNLTQDTEVAEEASIPGLGGVSLLKSYAEELTLQIAPQLPDYSSLAKIAADSLLFYSETIKNGYGRRVAIYYDFQSGKARLYNVTFQFPDTRNMIYDSSEVIANLNGTFSYEGDDQLERLYRQQIFKEGFFIDSIITTMEITDYSDNRISGYTVSINSYYPEERQLSFKNGRIEINPDHSGELSELLEFNDGTNSSRTVTFNGDYSGSFSGVRRDGTTVSGSFNRVWDDLTGYWNETVDFPDGQYIDKIMRAAQVAVSAQDSTFNGSLSEVIFFDSGEIDSAGAVIEVRIVNGYKTTTVNRTRKNGAHGLFIIQESADGSSLQGTWTTWDDHYIVITAEYYLDGSVHLHYEVYASQTAYNEGEDPIIIADYNLSPDSSGSGQISYNGEIYEAHFDGSGRGRLLAGGHTKMFEIFRK